MYGFLQSQVDVMMPLLAFCIYFSEIKSSVAGAELQELLGSRDSSLSQALVFSSRGLSFLCARTGDA
ncbi:hypothetical protein RU639_006377 [Aspergillus parasiticus]